MIEMSIKEAVELGKEISIFHRHDRCDARDVYGGTLFTGNLGEFNIRIGRYTQIYQTPDTPFWSIFFLQEYLKPIISGDKKGELPEECVSYA